MSRFIEPNLNPPDYDDGVTELQEAVLGVLEENLLPEILNDRICELVVFHERLGGDPQPVHSYAFHLAIKLRAMADEMEKRGQDRRCHMCRSTNMTACHHPAPTVA